MSRDNSADLMEFKGFDDLTIDCEDIIEQTCKELAEAIKSDAMAKWGSKSNYAKGWTYKMNKKKAEQTSGIVYNKTFSSLGGWLEFGHVVWNAKETHRTSPYPHILKNYQKQKEKFIKNMEKAKIK